MRRELGSIETLMSLSHKYFMGATQAMPVITLDREIEIKDLREAVYHLVRMHESLRCVIKLDNAKFRFEPISISRNMIESHVTECTSDSKDETRRIIDIELNKPVDSDYLLWRITLISCKENGKSKLLFSCHHAVIDTQSMTEILRDFLSILDSVRNNMLGPVDLVTFPCAVDEYLDDGEPDLSPVNITSVVHEKIAEIDKRKTQYIEGFFDTKETHYIEDKCSKHGLRLNSLIAGSLCRACVKSGMAIQPVAISSAVSVRDWSSSFKQENMGCYIGVAQNQIGSDIDDIESYSTEYQKKLVASMLSECLVRNTYSLNDLIKYFKEERSSTSFKKGIGISNLGEIGINPRLKSFNVVGYLPLTNRNNGTYPVVLHAWIFESKLHYMFMFTSPLVSEKSVKVAEENFLKTMRSEL